MKYIYSFLSQKGFFWVLFGIVVFVAAQYETNEHLMLKNTFLGLFICLWGRLDHLQHKLAKLGD